MLSDEESRCKAPRSARRPGAREGALSNKAAGNRECGGEGTLAAVSGGASEAGSGRCDAPLRVGAPEDKGDALNDAASSRRAHITKGEKAMKGSMFQPRCKCGCGRKHHYAEK